MAKANKNSLRSPYNMVLSWSGVRSRQAAVAFRDWLPKVLQAAKPWMSDADVDKGSKWGGEIGHQLDACRVGVVFVTSDNQSAPWLNYEAGALSKNRRWFHTRMHRPSGSSEAFRYIRAALVVSAHTANEAGDLEVGAGSGPLN